MTVAVLLLTTDSPLGACFLAGQRGIQFLQQTAAQLSDQIAQVPQLGTELVHQFRTWLDACVQQVLIIPADRPLLTVDTLRALLEQDCQPVVLLKDHDGAVAAACVDLSWLIDHAQTAEGHFSLEAMTQNVDKPALSPQDPAECLVVDSLPALAKAERVMRQRINLGWMQAGVQMIDPATIYLHATVTLGRGTVILPNTHLWGRTAVGQDCRIGPNTIVRDSEIGNQVVITASMVEEAVMEDQSDIGPFGHLRKGARVCRGAHMGNYGEIKNSVLGPNSKMGHFSYLGDAEIGEDVNIGAGVITCNYDGANKHKTIVGDGAFIGSDAMLVAPLEIGAGAQIGAGSVVTRDVPAGAVVYGVPARVKRIEKEGEDRSGPGK